jgi:hypothetical protein
MLWNHGDLPDDCVNREGSASHQSEDVKMRQEVNWIHL